MKNIKTLALMALMIVYTYTHAHAQSTHPSDTNIHGHVIDAATGEHMPYVTVVIRGTTIGVSTDRTGHFYLKNLPSGDFVVEASAVGYTTLAQEISLREGRSYEMNFTLHPAAINLSQVVVSANRTETNRMESATIVNVADGKLFESTASNALSDALNFQPGLRVEFNCGNCGVPQLRINGLEGQYSQILLDSRPLFSSLANVYGLEQLPVGMIERVEVIRGGGSALYGSSAIGGVVNIITKEPVRNSLSLSNTTQIMEGGKTDVNTSINGSFVSDDYRAGIYVFGAVRDREAYDRNGDGFSEIPKINSETIGFRGFYKTGTYSKLTVEYHHIREFRRGGNEMDRPPHESDITEQLRHGINGGGLSFNAFSRNYKHKWSVFTSFQKIKRDSYFGGGHNLDAYGNTKDDTFIAGGQYSYSMDKLLFSPAELTAGVEYTDNYLNDNMLGYNRVIRQTSRVFGGFVQNEWKSEKVNFIVGARLDKHNKIADPVFSPRANIRYTPSEHVILRAGYSSGYRAPQAYDEDLHVAAVGEGKVALIEVDPNLKPEYSNSVTGSVDLYATWGKVHANLLIEGFYTNLKDVFALIETGEDLEEHVIHMLRVNESGARIAGVNIEGKLALSDVNYFQFGYTWQQSKYKDPFAWSENEDLPAERRMLRSPDNYAYATLNFSPLKNTQVSLNGIYTGDMLVPHMRPDSQDDRLVKTPSFFDIGFKLSYDIKLNGTGTIQLNAGMKNVFDQFQRDLDYGADKDAGFIYGPALPRTFFFGAKFYM